MDSLNKTTLTLRWIGGVAMAIAAIQFMVSGRYDMNTLSAHYIFLGLNVFLCVLGIFCSHFLKEAKTARTFLGLSLAMIPVQMAQMGAYIYSHFNVVTNIPRAMQLTLPRGVNLGLIALISLVVLLPIIYLGFSVFFRPEKNRLSLFYAINSLLILLPFRHSHEMGLTLLLMVILNIICLNKLINLKTIEAQVSKLLLFIPTLIVTGRNLFYPNVDIFQSYMAIILSAILFYLAPKLTDELKLKKLFQELSIVSIIFATFFICSAVSTKYSLILILSLGVIQSLSYIAINEKKFRIVAASVLPFIMCYIFIFESVFVTTLCLMIPGVLLACSVYHKEKIPLIIHSITLTTFTFFKLIKVVVLPDVGLWQTLSVCGILLIVTSAIIEKKYSSIFEKVKIFKNSLS